MDSKLRYNFVVLIIGFCFYWQSNAQMYISPNSYVFATNTSVYIKQDLKLEAATSNFYLRNEAQLLQASTVASTNSGIGSLSTFQEGSSTNFQYNYWCSPVGGSTATAGNSPFGITQLKDVVDITNSNNSTILPISNRDGTASPLAIAPYWIWKLSMSNNYSQWVHVASASNLNAGEGFTMKGTSGTNTTTVNGVQNNSGSKQRYDFRGKPNDGTISIPVTLNQYTLTGNPYPSAIDLSAFLTDALNCTGIAYFWENDKTVTSHSIANHKGGYGTFSPVSRNGSGIYVPAVFYTYDGSGNPVANLGSSGNNYERRFSPIGQGFVILGSGAGSTVEMKNIYRVFVKEGVVSQSQFERNSNIKTEKKIDFLPQIQSVSGFDYTKVSTKPSPQIRFNTLLDNGGIKQIVLALIPEATDGIDRAMDGISLTTNSAADVYFVLNDSEYLINALPFDKNKKIQIGFRNKAESNYKITVNEILNFTGAKEVYLHDKITNLYHDIKNSFYDVTLPAGTNNTQYEITFKNELIAVVEEEEENKNFMLYQNNITKNLTINNPLLLDISSCSLYDISGRMIFNKQNLGSDASYKFSTANLSKGIYIVKFSTSKKTEIGHKILVDN